MFARMNLAGRFIVIDGPDGAGKGTQIERLAARITAAGTPCRTTRDPGGTEISNRIRHVILGYDLTGMDPTCEALLFMASRAQLVAEVVRPALAAGGAVVCDRFISATCAYQVAAGMPLDRVLALGELAVGQTWPDLTIILDVPPEVGFQRTGRTPRAAQKKTASGDQLSMFADAHVDSMERRPLDFHRQVRQNFLALPQRYPRPVRVLDANRPPDEVEADIWQAVTDVLS
jgi:dTMP kinase